MKDFDTLWREINADGTTTVQERSELEYIFNLIRGCKSYLEIGTAEGKSLYVLAHSLAPDAEITFVDLGEAHTKPYRDAYLEKLWPRDVRAVFGDSNQIDTAKQAGRHQREVVFIDAGHELFSVMADAVLYGPLAIRYLLFHDVTMPDVNRAFEWYAATLCPGKRSYKLINSAHYGYGVIEV